MQKKIFLRRPLLLYLWGTLVELSRRKPDSLTLIRLNHGVIDVSENTIEFKLVPIEYKSQYFNDMLYRYICEVS